MDDVFEDDAAATFQMNRHSELYPHFSWCIWHEGVRLFNDDFPGTFRPLIDLRDACRLKQQHNSYAEGLIDSASNNELRYVASQIEPRIESEHQLSVHFRWVAYHENQRRYFLDALDRRDFKTIRDNFELKQSHNPNAKNMLAGSSNAYIADLVNAL